MREQTSRRAPSRKPRAVVASGAAGSNARGHPRRIDRRNDILVAAEGLFAAKGYASVSVRDIAAAADVPLALVRYYFGRKEELFSFIFELRRAEITERMAGVAAVSGTPGPARARRVIKAWAGPVLRARADQTENSFAILVARSIWEAGDENRRIVERFYDPLARRFIAAMCEALPGAPKPKIVWAYGWTLGALLTFIADTRVERLSASKAKTADPARADDLLAFMTKGFLAAVQPDV